MAEPPEDVILVCPMDRLELLKNLLVMAVADGCLSAPEYDLVAARIADWGLSDAQFSEALEYALSTDARLTIPGLAENRDQVLQDLNRVIHADGDVADVEARLLEFAAAEMRATES